VIHIGLLQVSYRPLFRSSRGRSGALVGWDGCEVLVCPCVPCVNVNTTDATTGATALLLPAQNTHTLHLTPDMSRGACARRVSRLPRCLYRYNVSTTRLPPVSTNRSEGMSLQPPIRSNSPIKFAHYKIMYRYFGH